MQYECNYNHNLCILVQFPVPRLFVQVTCVRHLRCRLQARLAIADTDLLFFFLRALLLTHFRETDFFMGPHILTELEGIICKKKSIFFFIATPKPSQTKSQNPKSQNPNPNPGLGGFIITLNRYRRYYYYYYYYRRRRVLFEFSDFHYSYPNQIWNLSFWRQSRHLTSTSPSPLPPPPRPIWIFRLPVFKSQPNLKLKLLKAI